MKKSVLIILGGLILLIMLYNIAQVYSPGSYGDAEIYELPIAESELIQIIQKFKADNPKLQVSKEIGLVDERDKHWYAIYFYYPKEHQIIYTWTRSAGPNKTEFAFVSVNRGRGGWKWEDINRDLSSKENKSQIDKFEKRILNEIKIRIADN